MTRTPDAEREVISHDEAQRIAQKFIDYFFGNKGEPMPRATIPANPHTDDDIRLCEYSDQQARAALKPGDRGELLRMAEAAVENNGFSNYHQTALGSEFYCDQCQQLEEKGHDADCIYLLVQDLAAALREPQPQAPSAWPFDQIKPIPNATPPSAADDAVVEGLERRLDHICAVGYARGPDETAQDIANDNIELLTLTKDAIVALRSRRKT